MRKLKQKIIACIDFSNQGHRFYLMCLSIRGIAASGHQAICITEDTKPVREWMTQNHPELLKGVIWQDYIFRPLNLKNRNGINDIRLALHQWTQYRKVLKSIEQAYDIQIDLVSLHYADLFLSTRLPVFVQQFFFPYCWTGMYIHPRYLRMEQKNSIQHKRTSIRDIDYLFTSNRCKGIGVFDNGIDKALSQRLNKAVTLLPDISDVSEKNQTYELVQKIKAKANGRKVIGSVGISYYSGSIDLIKLALACKNMDFFFVFCGAFDEESYAYIPSEEDRQLLKTFRAHPADNCIWSEAYLKDEYEYNAVFKTLDIVYMMYPKHYNSSNRLTKAAYFRKFVLASNQYCVGENVHKFHLGATAAYGDIEAQKNILEKWHTGALLMNLQPDYDGYYALNNEKMFLKQLRLLLNI
jgi:hypothetical protein